MEEQELEHNKGKSQWRKRFDYDAFGADIKSEYAQWGWSDSGLSSEIRLWAPTRIPPGSR